LKPARAIVVTNPARDTKFLTMMPPHCTQSAEDGALLQMYVLRRRNDRATPGRSFRPTAPPGS
jgi:hypothetical protein